MKVPLSWLREFVDVPYEAKELAERLIAIGLKVERLHEPGKEVKGISVAKVLNVAPHPNADNLVLVDVDTGDTQTRVVCGARNFAPGDRVPFARVGSSLPGMLIDRRKIRGEVSDGMLCSARELGLGDDHSGILILAPNAEPGADVAQLLALDDPIFEFEITANRPDTMSIVGIAREVAAITRGELRPPDPKVNESGPEASELASVEIEDPQACTRYMARIVSGISVAPSPDWVQARLLAAGVRPVSNVVDATNFALLVTGHPMHAFDLEKLEGRRVVVRKALAGETITTIDGQERELDADDLLIADNSRPVGIAGVMGGLESEVAGDTKNILLEAAHFLPASIFRTAKRHGVRSEASARFERGADPNNIPLAADLATQLILEWAGGASNRAIDEYPVAAEPAAVSMRVARASHVLGMDISAETAVDTLSRLGLKPALKGDRIVIQTPTRRPDLTNEEDLIEEVARVIGYEQIPSTLPPGRSRKGQLTLEQRLTRKIRRVLMGAGLHEAWTSILIGPDDLERMAYPGEAPERHAPRITNPMSRDESLLRSTLLPGLVSSVKHNFSRRSLDIRLFEIGPCFLVSERIYPDEPLRVGLILAGHVQQEWHTERRELDLFDLKGAVEELASALHMPPLEFDPESRAPYHPARAARIVSAGLELGSMGQLSTEAAERNDLPIQVLAAELDLSALLQLSGSPAPPEAPGRFPAVYLDLAVTVPDATPAASVVDAARAAGGELLEEVRLFDLYRGEQVGEGRKGIAIALTFRSSDRTLAEAEAVDARERIANELMEKLDALVRG